MSNFFSNALRQAMTDKHFNQAQLAEYLNVDPAYISRWLKGSSPRLDQLTAVLSILGWSLERARPDYDAFSDAIESIEAPKSKKAKVAEKGSGYKNMTEIKSLLSNVAQSQKKNSIAGALYSGTVKGDVGTVDLSDSGSKELVSVDDLFEELNYAENQIIYLNVKTDSTDPLVQQGTKLFMRKVLRHQSVPTGAIVVLEPSDNPGTYQIRKLIRLRDDTSGRVDRLIGAPLSKEQDYIYFKPRDMKMVAVLIGTMTYPITDPIE